MANSNFLGALCNKLQDQELISKLYTGCSITGPRFNITEGNAKATEATFWGCFKVS